MASPPLLARWAPALLSALLAGCATRLPPGYPTPERPTGGAVEARSGRGRVLFGSPEELDAAARVARVIDAAFAPAGEAIGTVRDDPVEVWLDPTWFRLATTFERCVVFRSDPTGLEFADLLLTHEFVHWHSAGTPLQRHLPHAVLEGLCEHVAAELVTRWTEDRRAVHAGLVESARERGDLPRLLGLLDAPLLDFVALPQPDRQALTAIGFRLVDRIGRDTLCAAAEQGAVAAARALELAGVSPDGAGL